MLSPWVGVDGNFYSDADGDLHFSYPFPITVVDKSIHASKLLSRALLVHLPSGVQSAFPAL